MTRTTYIALLAPTLLFAVFCGAFWASQAVRTPEVVSLATECEDLGGEWLRKSARPICVREGELLVYDQATNEFVHDGQLSRAGSDDFAIPLIEAASATDICTQNFEDFAVTDLYAGRARVDFTTLPEANMHRTAISEDVNRGANFAGTYVVSTWGCGSDCRGSAVVNAQSGAILAYDLRSSVGEAYERESNLLVLDPDVEDKRTFVIENNNAENERLLEICISE
jgi:hypothetical protein